MKIQSIARVAAGAATAALLMTSLAACSSASTSDTATDTGNQAAAEMTDITVGIIAIADVAPVPLGVEKGFFEEEGLNVTLEAAPSGAAIVPAVQSGQYQFGFSNGLSLLLAAQQGIEVVIVGDGVGTIGDPTLEAESVVAREDSGISSAADLAGKTVGVAVRNSWTEIAISASVEEAGGDASTINYVEIPLPDIPAAVERGEIEAGQVVEPFIAASAKLGLVPVFSSFAQASGDEATPLTVSHYFTTRQYAEQNPEIVKRFVAALDQSKEYANGDPDAVRAALPSYTALTPELIEAIRLPNWPTGTDRASLELIGSLGFAGGLLNAEPDLDTILP